MVIDIKVHIPEEKEGQQEKNIENHNELNIDNINYTFTVELNI